MKKLILKRKEIHIKKLAKKIIAKHLKIDLVISSPAVRAIATAQILKNLLREKIRKLVVLERLYLTDASEVLRLIAETDCRNDVLMLVGHNPELDEIAKVFLLKTVHLRTGSLITLDFNVKAWSEITQSKPVKITCMTRK